MATRDKKSSITKSAISEGYIEITKPEEQKQDISKINRNTKDDTTNALKDEFDPKKIAERQEMAALFGELGANAIHKIAEANGWKDGSPEKIAMHAALAAVNAEIVKGNITTAPVTGGSIEALSNVILKAVGEAKGSSASAQWAAAVVGAALSTSTGGDAQSGEKFTDIKIMASVIPDIVKGAKFGLNYSEGTYKVIDLYGRTVTNRDILDLL